MKKTIRQLALVLLDSVLIQASIYLCFMLRFDGQMTSSIAAGYIDNYIQWGVAITLVKLAVFSMFQLYNSLWRYASVEELIQVVLASFFGTLAFFALLYFVQLPMPRSIVIMSGVLDLIFLGSVRFGYRAIRTVRDYGFNNITKKLHDQRILIIGAGEAGVAIAKEIKGQEHNRHAVVGFIDDDVSKQGRLINGINVLGDRYDIVRVAHQQNIDEIIIALPTSDRHTIKEIVDISTQTKCKLRILPSLSDLINGKVSVDAIRKVEIDDLLGRDEINLTECGYLELIEGKVVLVTGAGGSIGSEIVRQVLRHNPKQVILFDIYENNLYNLQQSLLREMVQPPIHSIIGSVRDVDRIEEVMATYKPQLVFHAAAHKHVPLMENSPKEAIKNNIFGTYNVISSAQKHGVERFVQISTDKAVNPTNVMGATKRACEILVQAMNGLSSTELIAVRFGNVLGSDGSVIPLFKKQIADGGPVTVTHKDIIRYFMTIPEATRLVIQAGTIGKGGEIFVLDMGEPVRIYDLAEKMIKLSGFEPHRDIEIEITGLRPGEKLYEELLIDDRHTISTELPKIFIETTLPLEWMQVKEDLDGLSTALGTEDNLGIKYALAQMVRSYRMGQEIL